MEEPIDRERRLDFQTIVTLTSEKNYIIVLRKYKEKICYQNKMLKWY